jgi:DNA-binding NtrC family response regulator
MDASQERILVVDDEAPLRSLFERVLKKEGYEVRPAASGDEALKLLETEWFDLVITDLKMPGMDGMELLAKGKSVNPTLPFIVLTAFGTVRSAVAAVKEGAYDYLVKPFDLEELKLVIKNALELHRLTREVERLRTQLELDLDFEPIIGQSKAMRAIFGVVRMVAQSNATILIQGESGTGKELIAKALHHHSQRRNRPFVAINCGSLPETLLESELFGHVRGAFTGAIHNKKGLFEEAHEGTLLLDEIGDTTNNFQSKLLRVLQENEIRPLGSNQTIKIDVRVIAATNKNLRKEVDRKNFREDLFYRLNVVPIVLPPLRERTEDIPLLVNHFIDKYTKPNGLERKRISPTVLRLLMDHAWPGNVRELENVIARAALINPRAEIDPDTLFPAAVVMERETPTSLRQTIKGFKDTVEREKIAEALEKTNGNRSRAARLLGISRSALYNKLRV